MKIDKLNRGIATELLLAMIGSISLCPVAHAEANSPRIAWYGTLESGLAAAKRSGRPILLISGAPHCHGVSGIW